jgi:hypothetical protein
VPQPVAGPERDVERELLYADWLLLEATTKDDTLTTLRFQRAAMAYLEVFDALLPRDRNRVAFNVAMIGQRLGRTADARRWLAAVEGESRVAFAQALMEESTTSGGHPCPRATASTAEAFAVADASRPDSFARR